MNNENIGEFGELIEVFDCVEEDGSLPRTIKTTVCEVRNCLFDKNVIDLNLKKNDALFRLESIVDDPNLPSNGRVVLYDLMGKIELL